MRSKTLSTMFALLLGLGLVAAACSSDDESAKEANSETTSTTMASEGTETTMAGETGTIVDIAAGNPDFSTLVELVTAAGLGETLAGEGPFTVFAPTY